LLVVYADGSASGWAAGDEHGAKSDDRASARLDSLELNAGQF